MNLKDKVFEYETQYGFPWELVLSLLMELISDLDCINNKTDFVKARETPGPFDRAILGWRIRRAAREERVRGDVRGLRDQMLADYANTTESEANILFDTLEACCNGQEVW